MVLIPLHRLVIVALILLTLSIALIPRRIASYTAPSAPLVPVLVSTTSPAIAPVPLHLKPVCNCESEGDPNVDGRQFNPDGSVVHGPGNNWGICQINATAHEARAKALGIDYMTREGNIAFAELLYSERGYRPWYKWSGHCWKDDPRIDQEKLAEIL